MELKKNAAFIMIHGQGIDKKNSHKELFKNIKSELKYPDEILFVPVKYYSEVQNNQKKLMDRVINRMGCGKLISIVKRRLAYTFGDSATIKGDNNTYDKVMSIIKESLIIARANIRPNAPIFIMGHSLGAILLSNFLWDMQKAGIFDEQIKGIFTTGSPDFIFVSGIKDIIPIQKTQRHFFWINFWNKKDILSSPMKPFSFRHSILINDIRVRKGWPVLAHGKYDGDKKVYKKIAEVMRDFY